RGIHPDVLVVEPGDTGSIKIEQIRDLNERTAYRPFEGRRRVVIIVDADALVASAQNALLKTLEEPPPSSVFILVTSMPDQVLPTESSSHRICGRWRRCCATSKSFRPVPTRPFLCIPTQSRRSTGLFERFTAIAASARSPRSAGRSRRWTATRA